MQDYIMSLDQGTSSSRCVIFNKQGEIVSLSQKEIQGLYPKPGYVEQDPYEIWSSQLFVANDALLKASLTYKDIASIGITNQRETTILWEKETGRPIYNAIVWQCRRTSSYCNELKAQGYEKMIKQKTGLIIDAYFSATKIKWILDNVEGARDKAKNGEILFGTVDSWLVYNLTNKKVHVTDYSNASRTMIFNINTLCWDEELLKLFDIDKQMLPQVLPSSYVYGETDKQFFGGEIKISGIAGDQQAALFGQRCFNDGSVKNTFGTGCFILMNTGNKKIDSNNGLLTTIAWGLDNTVTYALEGSVFVAGAAIKWLRDGINMVDCAASTESYAQSVDDTLGVYVVPAFSGLGAPYWDQDARGIITGLTAGAGKAHIVRATLESLAYQSFDVIKAMEKDSSLCLNILKVDGGASANNFLMQFQSDILNINVERPAVIESTALGAMYLAGLAVGFYKNIDEIKANCKIDMVFKPNMPEDVRDNLLNGWADAVKRTFSVL